MLFFLYAVLDLYNRKLVAREVHARESGGLAAELLERTRWRERPTGRPLILHADHGAVQRSLTLRAKMQELCISPSYSRAGVSDDSAFIESWFRTLKYVPAYPSKGIGYQEQAREWTRRFVDWYNGEHRHREIGRVTPNQRHSGQSQIILEQRRQVHAETKRPPHDGIATSANGASPIRSISTSAKRSVKQPNKFEARHVDTLTDAGAKIHIRDLFGSD